MDNESIHDSETKQHEPEKNAKQTVLPYPCSQQYSVQDDNSDRIVNQILDDNHPSANDTTEKHIVRISNSPNNSPYQPLPGTSSPTGYTDPSSSRILKLSDTKETTNNSTIKSQSTLVQVGADSGDSSNVKFKNVDPPPTRLPLPSSSPFNSSQTTDNPYNNEMINNVKSLNKNQTKTNFSTTATFEKFRELHKGNSDHCSDRPIQMESLKHCDMDIALENIETDETSACLNDYHHNVDHDDDDNVGNDFKHKLQTRTGGLQENICATKPTSIVKRIYNRLTINLSRNNYDNNFYTRYEDGEDDSVRAGSLKYDRIDKVKKSRTFRGSYKYSRAEVSMAIIKKTINLLSHKSTLALFGAFLIHVTLGTVYTLSNVNSYMTSYMRKNGNPNATYGAAVWISSSYSVGQGFSMVLGGYLEKRFSARLSCMIGCAIHSLSIISTYWSIHYGILCVLITYGLLPGFGCGLAYMTPMSNGFAWFPNRRGLVAGVILAGFGIGTFVFNMAQTGFVNPKNLSPEPEDNGYFTQKSVLDNVPDLFVFMGSIYGLMQLIGCALIFKPTKIQQSDERPIIGDHHELDIKSAIKTIEFKVLFIVYGLTTQGVLFVNSILKEYGQIYIRDDSYLAWVGSMASIANSLGRLVWGLAIDKYSFTTCFTCITIIFGGGLFITPFKFVLSNKLMYLTCTLIMFGSFSGWMSTYPVHLSRVYGRTNSGMIYGLIYISQAIGGIVSAFAIHYLIDHYNRFVPFYCIVALEALGLIIYILFYPNHYR